MTVTLIVTTDGRAEFLEQTLASIDEHLRGDIGQRLLWDDSGDAEHRRTLKAAYGDRYEVGWPGEERVGYQVSLRTLWERLVDADAPFVAHWEDDFLLNHDVELSEMEAILDLQPKLAQVALLRAPYYEPEHKPGTILGWKLASFRDRSAGGLRWLEHRLFFTCNPNVYRRDLCGMGWPQQDSSERIAGNIMRSQGMRFSFLGHRSDPPALTHIGAYRAGGNY